MGRQERLCSRAEPRHAPLSPDGADDGGLTLRTALPLAVPPGESASLQLTSPAGAALPDDQALFIDVSLGER